MNLDLLISPVLLPSISLMPPIDHPATLLWSDFDFRFRPWSPEVADYRIRFRFLFPVHPILLSRSQAPPIITDPNAHCQRCVLTLAPICDRSQPPSSRLSLWRFPRRALPFFDRSLHAVIRRFTRAVVSSLSSWPDCRCVCFPARCFRSP